MYLPMVYFVSIRRTYCGSILSHEGGGDGKGGLIVGVLDIFVWMRGECLFHGCVVIKVVVYAWGVSLEIYIH